MTIYALLSLLVAIFTISIGFYVFVRSTRTKISQLFFFFTITATTISIIQFQLRIANSASEAYLWSKIFAVWPFSLLFAVQFVLELNRKKKRTIFFYILLYTPAIVISYIQFTTDYITTHPIHKYWGWSIQYTQGLYNSLALIYGIVYWMIALTLLYYYHKKFTGKAKKQALFVFIGFLISFIITLIFDVEFPVLGYDFPEFGNVSTAIAISIIAYGILHYDLYTIDNDPLLSKLFTSLSNYLILVDHDNNILEINDKLLRRLNYNREDLINKNIDVLFATVETKSNPLSNYIDQYTTFDNKDISLIIKDGEELTITFSASFVKFEENLQQGLIYVGNEDCSSKNNQELHANNTKQTSFLAESALDIIKSTKTDEIYKYITAKLYSLYNEKAIVIYVDINERESFINWAVKSIIGLGETRKTISRLIGFNLNQLKGVSRINSVNGIAEGKLINIDFNLSEYTNGVVSKGTEKAILKILGYQKLSIIPIHHKGKVSGIIAVLSPSDTPQINTNLVESFVEIASVLLKRKYYENELADLNEMKTKLFSVIGHDLRSPLANIMGFTDLIIEDFDNYSRDMLLEYFESIQRSTEAGFNILDGLLLWSKSIQGGVSFKPEIIDLKKVAEESLGQVSQIANKKGIRIVNNIEYDIFLSADKNMIVTVIRNLLSNAIKFTKSGGNIHMTTMLQKAQVQLSIIDDGIGMSPEQLKKLFKPDNLFLHKGTDGEKGSGFGLLICKDFVEKNSGRIIVESEEGKGSTFSLVFQRINDKE